MHTTLVKTCPNCGVDLETDFKYCPNCTQSTHLHRITLGHFGHEIFHAVTHTDKSAISLARDLVTRPGIVAREYILEGKRKKYFNPYTFLLLVLAATLLMYSIVKPLSRVDMPRPTASELAKMSPEKQRFARLAYEKQKEAIKFTEQQAKLVTISVIPVIAFFFWVFLRRRGLNYAEHLVINIFIVSITSVWSLLLVPLFDALGMGVGSPVSQFLYIALAVGYIAVGYHQFFRKDKPLSWFKAIGLATLSYFVYLALATFVMGIYVGYAAAKAL